MMTCKLGLLLCSVLASHQATAGVVFERDVEGPLPKYFSCTNSRAYHHAHVTDPTLGFTRSELWVGSELVAQSNYLAPDAGGRYVYEVGHRVMFDSTHFAHGTVVVVTMRVWTTDGGSYLQDTWSATVDNQGSYISRFDMAMLPLGFGPSGYEIGDLRYIGIWPSKDGLEGMGYQTNSLIYGLGWNHSDLFEGLTLGNIVYVETHGSTDSIWSDTNDFHYFYPSPPIGPPEPENCYPLGIPAGVPNAFSFQQARIYANGTGLPPTNSTEKPPYNIAYFDACLTGYGNDFAESTLYPYGNVFVPPNPFPENQSEIGYEIEFILHEKAACVKAFWSAMSNGLTAHLARDACFQDYKGSNKPSDARDFQHVWGDYFTRLKGVYTGDDNGGPSEWYKEVAN